MEASWTDLALSMLVLVPPPATVTFSMLVEAEADVGLCIWESQSCQFLQHGNTYTRPGLGQAQDMGEIECLEEEEVSLPTTLDSRKLRLLGGIS